MKVLFISPHLDDVVFSCGATVAKLARRGDDLVLATVFTRSVATPTGFALACQTDKGLAPDVDYMALRRAEDERAAAALGITTVMHLGYLEAPHRGYVSAAALFGEVRADDVELLFVRHWLDTLAPDVVFVPQALGGHVDHVRVTLAFLASGWPGPAHFYRDTPYVLRHFDEPSPVDLGPGADHFEAVSADDIARKVAAARAYETQVPFQFSGRLEESLADLAEREGACGGVDLAERTFVRR